MNALTYWRGRWRLLVGYCPRCNSSPPRPNCDICLGSCNYGPTGMSGPRRRKLRQWWDAAR